jgi:hypothetical protein
MYIEFVAGCCFFMLAYLICSRARQQQRAIVIIPYAELDPHTQASIAGEH